MNDKQRLKELEAKLEKEGLTDTEVMEIALIHSRALNAARENCKLLLKELRESRERRGQRLKY